jgi:hypothetical protein
MSIIQEILLLQIKPKEKQSILVENVVSGKIHAKQFIDFFESASDVDKGACAE